MNSKKIVAMALVVLMVFSFVGFSDTSAAAPDVSFGDSSSSASGFTDMESGTVTFSLKNNTSSQQTIIVKIVNFDNTNEVFAAKEITIEANANVNETVGFSFGSSGTRFAYVQIVQNSAVIAQDGPIEINVTHSMWKDATTYIFIIAVIIIAVVLVYLYMRNAPKRATKEASSEKTFTKMNEEKKIKKVTTVEKYEANDDKKAKRK